MVCDSCGVDAVDSSTKKNAGEKKTDWNPLEVRWAETHTDIVDRFWSLLPRSVKPWLLSFSVFILGITIRGDWVLAVVHLLKHIKQSRSVCGNGTTLNPDEPLVTYQLLEEYFYVWLLCNSVAYLTYFFVGGFLHWYYYCNQRDQPEQWKCQPKRWLSPELERDEIWNGSISLLVTNTFTASLTFYVKHDGWSLMYLGFSEYTWLWWFLQWPVILFVQDYLVYNLHRMYHTPFFYKRFHKLHHRYKQPTAFSVTAIHPFEILHIQVTLCLIIFIVPLHWVPFYGVAFYTFYHGIMDHSGIDFKAPWWQPWRPDTMFHDNHHQYFHVNFSFNCYYWDLLHGTYRRPDRVYNEDIYYGRGRPLDELSEREIAEEEIERSTENPLAHRQGSEYLLPKDRKRE